ERLQLRDYCAGVVSPVEGEPSLVLVLVPNLSEVLGPLLGDGERTAMGLNTASDDALSDISTLGPDDVLSDISTLSPGNFTVQVRVNYSTRTVTCDNNLPPDVINGFVWVINQNVTAENNKSISVPKIKNKMTFTCTVLTQFGNFTSPSYEASMPEVPGKSVGIVLMVCGIGAFFVILMFGITMKIMLKRGEIQRQARRQQRQAMQSNDSTATVISYW
ncbi:hypothetical protein QTP70_024278, partial [Hemibagrus guttatus]